MMKKRKLRGSSEVSVVSSKDVVVKKPKVTHVSYNPLDRDRREIRLLLVKAASESEPLQCELQQAFLGVDPLSKYETISYCWGDPTMRSYIILNGRKKRVPASAKAALQRMRYVDRDRVLWIDSVCINQSDRIERGHQVSIMSEIYSHTQRNLVWLGEDNGTTAKALESMDAVLRNAREETDDFKIFQSTIAGKDDWQASTTGLGFNWDAEPLLDFYARPWFGRLWVVQETALAPCNTCICGTHETPLQQILKAAAWLHYKRRFLPFSIRRQEGIRNAYRLSGLADPEHGRYHPTAHGSTITLRSLLQRSRQLQTSDARDHVYGLVGLYQRFAGLRDLPELLIPDYEKPLADVLRDATRFALIETRHLWILDHVDHIPGNKSKYSDMPSWVPLWHTPYRTSGYNLDFRSDDDVKMEPPRFLNDGNILSLTGFAFDTVSVVAPKFPEATEEQARVLAQILSLLGADWVSKNAAILGRTLIGGENSQHEMATEQQCLDFLLWSEFLLEQSHQMLSLRQLLISNGDYEDRIWKIMHYNRAFYSISKNRTFFMTASGGIGLGPQDVEADDVITVLYGSRYPVILRRQDAHFSMIGASYIQDVMHGEAVRKHKAEGRDDSVFHIC